MDIAGDARPEIVAAAPDGAVYAVGPNGKRLWRHDFARSARRTFASEVVAADLNRDGRPELVFATYSLARNGGRLIGLSVDPLDRHADWARDIAETQGTAPDYPIVSDADFNVSKLYGMLPASVEGDPLARTPADNQTVRSFDEVLRVIDSLQLTANHKVATPAQWQLGQDVIIAGSLCNDQAKEIWPEGWTEPKPYIRIVPQPT